MGLVSREESEQLVPQKELLNSRQKAKCRNGNSIYQYQAKHKSLLLVQLLSMKHSNSLAMDCNYKVTNSLKVFYLDKPIDLVMVGYPLTPVQQCWSMVCNHRHATRREREKDLCNGAQRTRSTFCKELMKPRRMVQSVSLC